MTGNYSGNFAYLAPSSKPLETKEPHTFYLVVGKPAALRVSAGTDPGSTIMQQPILSAQFLSATQDFASCMVGKVGKGGKPDLNSNK